MKLNFKRIIIFSLLLLCFKLSGQEQVTIFYNQNWEITSPAKATYYRFTKINSTGDFYDGKYTDFLVKDTKMIASGEYSSNKKNGEFIEYYSNGNIKKKGNYKNDNLFGKWYYYYSNGQLKMIISFSDRAYNPIECRDSLNNITLENGTGNWETDISYKGITAKLIAKFKKGEQSGDWKYVDKSGKEISSKEFINTVYDNRTNFLSGISNCPYIILNSIYDFRFSNMERRLCEIDLNLKFAPFNWVSLLLNLSNTKNLSSINSKLPADQILFIKEDSYNNTWIGTGNNGLIKYDSVFTFYNKDNTPIKSNYVSCMQIDNKGKIWFTFESPVQLADLKTAGLACLSNNNIVTYNTSNSGLTNNGIRDIAVDKNNKKWFATENCIISYDDSTNKWEKHFNKEVQLRKVDTIKYKNRDEYLHYAKEIDSYTHYWEIDRNRRIVNSQNNQSASTERYYSTMTFYELPINFYSIEILPTNEKLINSRRNGCCIYNDMSWECDTIYSNLQYVKLLLTRKFQLDKIETWEYMNQLSRIMEKNTILQLIPGIDNSLWVRTNNDIFKVTKTKIIEYDVYDQNIQHIQDGDFKTKFYYLYQDKVGGIWVCINSAILKIE